MTRAGERWAGWFAQVLDGPEREAALGDLVEASATDGEALRQICGLALRRQFELWKDWRPWLALIGIAGVSGFLLDRMTMRSSLSVASDYWVRSRFGVHYENGLTAHQNEIVVMSELIAEASFSWASGLLAGVLARKASWMVAFGISFYAVWPLILFVRFLPQSWQGIGSFVLFPELVRLSLLLLPMFAGMHKGKRAAIGLRSAVVLSLWLLFVIAWMTWVSGWWQEAMVRWSEGAWHPGEAWPIRLLPYLYLSWPAGYLVVLAVWRKRKERGSFV